MEVPRALPVGLHQWNLIIFNDRVNYHSRQNLVNPSTVFRTRDLGLPFFAAVGHQTDLPSAGKFLMSDRLKVASFSYRIEFPACSSVF